MMCLTLRDAAAAAAGAAAMIAVSAISYRRWLARYQQHEPGMIPLNAHNDTLDMLKEVGAELTHTRLYGDPDRGLLLLHDPYSSAGSDQRHQIADIVLRSNRNGLTSNETATAILNALRDTTVASEADGAGA